MPNVITIDAPSGTDQTVALYRQFKQVQAGDTVVFPVNQSYTISEQTCTYPAVSPTITEVTGDFEIAVDNVTIIGNGCTITQMNVSSTVANKIYGFLRLSGNNCTVDNFTVKGGNSDRKLGGGKYLGYPEIGRSSAVMVIGDNITVKNVNVENMFVGVNLRGPVLPVGIATSATAEKQRRYDYSGRSKGTRLLNLRVKTSDFGVIGTQQESLVIDGLYFQDGTFKQAFPPHAIYLTQTNGVPITLNTINTPSVDGAVVTNVVVNNAAYDEALKFNGVRGLNLSNFSILNSCGGITVGQGKDVVISSGTIVDYFRLTTGTDGAGNGVWLENCDGVQVNDLYLAVKGTGDTASWVNGVLSQSGSRNIRVENVTVLSNYKGTGSCSPFRVVGSNAYGKSEMECINCTHIFGGDSNRTFVAIPATSTSVQTLEFPSMTSAAIGPFLPLAYDGSTTPVAAVDPNAYTYTSSSGNIIFNSGYGVSATDVVTVVGRKSSVIVQQDVTVTALGSPGFTIATGLSDVWAYRKGLARQKISQISSMAVDSAVWVPRIDPTKVTFDPAACTVWFDTSSGSGVTAGEMVVCHWKDNGMMITTDPFAVPASSGLKYMGGVVPVGTVDFVAYRVADTGTPLYGKSATLTTGYDYDLITKDGFIAFTSHASIPDMAKVILKYKRADGLSAARLVYPSVRGLRTHSDFYNYANCSTTAVINPDLIDTTQASSLYEAASTPSTPVQRSVLTFTTS